ncbi:MAG: alpha-1,2-fucosyltransferase [Hungatella sp.]|nr:alpha-1,2-fucosyltransferase [Hungatella sp.]
MRIMVDVVEGFGNQLFCYCFGYALSREKGARLMIDTSMQDNRITRELQLLNLQIKYDDRIFYKYKKDMINRAVFNKLRKRRMIGFNTKIYLEKEPTQYDEGVFHITGDTYFRGYWQNEKYFIKYREELMKILVPVERRPPNVEILLSEVKNCNSVALHVRRGDYLKNGSQIKMNYYDEAVKKLKDIIHDENIVIYVFSDDLEFCKNYFNEYEGGNVRFLQYESENKTFDDFLLMSNCKHIITANSTYSWWAAWLNQNEKRCIICPEAGMCRGDFYPEDWHRIRCEKEG